MHLIELFVADHCPGCPDARLRLQEFVASRSDVLLLERRIEEHLELARRYGLFATPAAVVDGYSVLYGTPTLAQLDSRCRSEIVSTGT